MKTPLTKLILAWAVLLGACASAAVITINTATNPPAVSVDGVPYTPAVTAPPVSPPPVSKPPAAPPQVLDLSVTPEPDRHVSVSVTPQAGVLYDLAVQEDDGAKVIPVPDGQRVELPATFVAPTGGQVFGVLVTPVRDGIKGPAASKVVDFNKLPTAPVVPPPSKSGQTSTPPSAPATGPPPATPAGQIAVHAAPAGLATFVDGRALVPEEQRTSQVWTWDFGDPGGAHNILKGFNSAHVYEKPGTYTIKLTIGSQTYSQTVTVPPSARKLVNVPAGADLAQYSQAQDVELVLAQGATYTASQSVICRSDVVIRGNGATLNLQASVEGFRLGSDCRLSGLRIDYPAGANPATSDFGPVNMAIYPMGPAVTVDGCTFLNVGYCVNGNAKPDNVLVQDCNAPLLNGLRGYLAWVEGGAWTIVGNTVKNPFIEHDVRCESGAGPLAIVDNHLDNLGQADSGVKGDNPKGSIVLHYTVDAYVAGNTVATYGTEGGGIGAGPLMVTFSQANPERTRRTVIEDNTLNDAPVRLDPGAIDTVIRGNVFNVPADHPHPFDAAIVIRSIDGARGRDVEGVVIQGNRIVGNAAQMSVTLGVVKQMQSDWRSN